LQHKNHPYEALTPDRVIKAIEQTGLHPDARLYPLNSYENRVYQVGIQDQDPVVVKFYRPARWSDQQILEEHEFSLQLQELEVPVAAPISFANGSTLLQDDKFKFAVFPRLPGRAPDVGDPDNLAILGRYIARVHRIGARTNFSHRASITIVETMKEAAEYLLENDFIPLELQAAYESLTRDLVDKVAGLVSNQQVVSWHRIHGDCHLGNVLWFDSTPSFVDFDDAVNGPAVQDLWMLLSGDRNQRQAQLMELLDGYTEFNEFNAAELPLIEPLRSMRIMHYSAWLARRWEDPTFPRSFPWFNTTRYWSEQILALREQFAALDEPPLQVFN